MAGDSACVRWDAQKGDSAGGQSVRCNVPCNVFGGCSGGKEVVGAQPVRAEVSAPRMSRMCEKPPSGISEKHICHLGNGKDTNLNGISCQHERNNQRMQVAEI